MTQRSAADLTDPSYWDAAWTHRGLPEAIHPHSGRSQDHFYDQFHRKMSLLFAGLDPRRSRLLEVGCGSSAWLPYFAREFGFQISGLDYSEVGCAQTRALLARERVQGEVVLGDLFSPPEGFTEGFDVVFSFGVVEHFSPPSRCVRAMAALLRPGGLMVSVVPNLTGVIGALQSWINKPVLDVHVLHTAGSLSEAHREADMEVIEGDYFFGNNFGWVNETGAPSNALLRPKLRVLSAFRWASRLSWWVEQKAAPMPASRALSPTILCLARKPT